MLASLFTGHTLIAGSAFLGLLFAAFQLSKVMKIKLKLTGSSSTGGPGYGSLLANEAGMDDTESKEKQLLFIYQAISDGADSFLHAEYRLCAIFLVAFSVILCVSVSVTKQGFVGSEGLLTSLAFLLGGATSIACGYIGMRVAVYSNARTTVAACAPGPAGWTGAFNTAFRAGSVMGFCTSGMALLTLYGLCSLLAMHFTLKEASALFDCVAGFGLGASSVALFGRVGGGIYTKAADVGADLAGKVVEDLPEDDPRNPAVIADNVGDNVGDVAGMGSDLFGSFAEASCAALVIGASSPQLVAAGWHALMFPLHISAAGILVCMVTTVVATDFMPVMKPMRQPPHRPMIVQAKTSSGVAVTLTPPARSMSKLFGRYM